MSAVPFQWHFIYSPSVPVTLILSESVLSLASVQFTDHYYFICLATHSPVPQSPRARAARETQSSHHRHRRLLNSFNQFPITSRPNTTPVHHVLCPDNWGQPRHWTGFGQGVSQPTSTTTAHSCHGPRYKSSRGKISVLHNRIEIKTLAYYIIFRTWSN